jgi:hypothetical protein
MSISAPVSPVTAQFILMPFQVIEAREKWEKKKVQDAKWAKEDKERGVKDDFEDDDDMDGQGEVYGAEKKEKKEEMAADLVLVISDASYANVEASCRKGLAIETTSRPLLVRLQCLRDAGHVTDEAADLALKDTTSAATFKALGTHDFAMDTVSVHCEYTVSPLLNTVASLASCYCYAVIALRR